jgi:hypothetical protein
MVEEPPIEEPALPLNRTFDDSMPAHWDNSAVLSWPYSDQWIAYTTSIPEEPYPHIPVFKNDAY